MPLQQQQLKHLIVLVSALIAGIVMISRAGAQGIRFGPDPSRSDPNQGVYVPDSAKVVENLALAQRLERLKEWDKAADVYQEIVEKYSDKVVALNDDGAAGAAMPGDDSKEPRRYASVSLRVQELLGKWPDEGLQRYRARNENSAAAMLESAGIDDVAGLSHVMQRYFPTDAAKAAGFRLIELYIENGEFPAAAWVGERMLAHHPGVTDADRPKLLFRTALAEHLGNDKASAKRNADDLTGRFAGATGTWRGQDVVLSAELAKILSGPAAVARGGTSADVWPTVGGDATRGRIPAAGARPSARLPVDISTGRGVAANRNAARGPAAAAAVAAAAGGDQTTDKSLRDQGAYLNILPAVDRGEIYFQDGQRLYAEGLESGLPLPGWSIFDDAPASQVRPMAARAANNAYANAASGAQFSVTLTDSSVLAVLRLIRQGPERDFAGNVPQTIVTPLVCHDRATGAQRWSVTPSQLPQRALHDLELGGSPLVVGENVYVAARGGRAAETQNAYIICLGLRDGKFKWACYLSATSVSLMNGAMAGQAATSYLAYAGGRIYAVTNLGSVAAVDAYSGTIVWLTLYPHPPVFGAGNFMGAGGAVMTSSIKPWAQNPPIVKDGKVFCLPSDSNALYVYDAGTGAELKRISLVGQLDSANTLLGVVGERVILNSLNKVFCINWTTFPDQGDDYWAEPVTASGTTDKDSKDVIRGRGFVTADSVFIPTTSNLQRYELDKGRLGAKYPPDGAWTHDQHEEPGNVLVTSDQVIITGQYYINVYSDLGLVLAKFDHEIDTAPNDPLPRLKKAEILFAKSDTGGAVTKLDEAIKLLGGTSTMRPGPLRDRVFARSMAFAERSANPTAGVPDLNLVNSLYDRAAAAAYSPQQNVTYRLSRAKFVHDQHKSDAEQHKRDWTAVVRLNQEILANPAWRTSLVSNGDEAAGYASASASVGGNGNSSAIPAHVIAERNIDDVLRSYREAYAPFEKAAGDGLAAAQAQNDPQAMLAVAQVYPNAKIAPRAMLAAAQAFEDARNNREATRVLAEAYRKYHDENSDAKASILEAQARNYLLLPGGMGVAIGRLNEGLKIPGEPRLTRPLKLPDGDTIDADTKFSVATMILQGRVKRETQATLPDFKLPRTIRTASGIKFFQPWEPVAPETVINDCDRLLLPPSDLRDRTRYDRVVTWTKDRGISVYAVGGTAPLGTAAVGDNKAPPRGAMWFGKDLVVWTSEAVIGFKGDVLAPGWRFAVGQMEVPEVVEADPAVMQNAPAVAAGGAEGEGQAQVRIFPGRGFRFGGPQPMPIIGPAGVVGPAAVGQPGARPGGGGGIVEQILFLYPVGDRAVFITNFARIAAVEVSSGQLAWQTRVADSMSESDQIVASDDFLAARYGTPEGARIIALDAYAGQIVFADFPGNDLPPQNLTLSSDGVLVYTLADRIRAKDLFEPGKSLKFPDTPIPDPNSNNRPFEGANLTGQLVVTEGRILALADHGQFVRVYSAEDGQPFAAPSENPTSTRALQRLPISPVATQADQWKARIRVVGTRVYIFHDRIPGSYNLDHLSDKAPLTTTKLDGRIVTDDVFVGKEHLVLVTALHPNDQQPGKGYTGVQLLAYGRYAPTPNSDEESGRLDQNPTVPYPTEITQWQPVEGGFYFCGADRRAHFLKGGAAAAAAAAAAASQPAATRP